MDELVFKITEENNIGARIDKYLSDRIEGKSRSFIQGLIESGSILVNGNYVKSNYKLREKDRLL